MSTTTFVPVPEAAFLAGLTDKQIQRAVDEDILGDPLVKTDNGRRFAKLGSAMVKFYYTFERLLTADARREVISIVVSQLRGRSDWERMLALDAPSSSADWSIGLSDLHVDLAHVIRSVQERIQRVESASRYIQSDPDVMGGLPVFRNTRIPIDIVLAANKKMSSNDELRRHYPDISDAEIEAAQIYQLIHPKRGRPPGAGATGSSGMKVSSAKRIARKR